MFAVGGRRAQRSAVSAAALQVPGKARGQYGKARGDVKAKKLQSAEQPLRKAVEEYPQYAAAWVLLGQVSKLASGPGKRRARVLRQQLSIQVTLPHTYVWRTLPLSRNIGISHWIWRIAPSRSIRVP